MLVYRIVKGEKRVHDLSGTGAFKYGGRWNSVGVYMLYTSENSSLAYLETLVHTDKYVIPKDLFIITISVNDKAPIYTVTNDQYPINWKTLDNIENKILGDQIMLKKEFLGFKIKSAINDHGYNYLLNPLFPDFDTLVEDIAIQKLIVDSRLIR
ncbi:MAG: RES domain-containing protein [Sphingobacteriaceae bacterium]|nr:MAG: RES domain-containing protein [Sphingobacteriaceae bacterium]